MAKKIFLLIFCLSLGIYSGCGQSASLEKAQQYQKESQGHYKHALSIYKGLINKGKDLDKLYFELGRLYYMQGDFSNASDALNKSNDLKAKKLLGISNFSMGNFTDALEAFNKYEIYDDEYLYYYGLTSEKLNLFDEALKAYKKIKGDEFGTRAKARLAIIEKQESGRHIKDVDQKAYQILAAAPKAEDYPQAGALILSSDEEIEVSSEGTSVSYLHYLIKILNERGKEGFSETHIDYDSTYEKVELVYARTIKPDGIVADVGSRHIRDVSKYLNFPLYSNARVYIISFPEIAEGSIIEYKVKVYRGELINKKDFVLSYSLQASEPIISAIFSISVPKERKLNIKTINEEYNDFGARLEAYTEEKKERLTYRWQFKNIPQIIPEANMPPEVNINPTLLISTFNSWQEIYNWWWSLAKDKISADDSIKKKVAELIKDKHFEEEKARAIYNYCAQNIRYVAVEYGQAGYEPHLATDIFKNKYGDCKDKAILLIAMLKEALIPGWPVLIATKDYYNLNEDFPSVMFNHAIAAVRLNDKTIFLDATAQTCSFADLPADDQARRVLLFKPEGYQIEETPAYPAEHNRVKQALLIKINMDESIFAEKTNLTFGVYDQAQRYWLLYTQPQLIREMLKEKVQDVSIGAKLSSYNIENLGDLNKPVVLSYAFNGPEYFTAAGALRILPQLAGIETSLVAKDSRKYAIDFGILDTKETLIEIEMPGNFTVKYIPESVNEESPWLKFTAEYKRDHNKLYLRQILQLKKSSIPADEYPEFKIFFENLAKNIKQRILLERMK